MHSTQNSVDRLVSRDANLYDLLGYRDVGWLLTRRPSSAPRIFFSRSFSFPLLPSQLDRLRNETGGILPPELDDLVFSERTWRLPQFYLGPCGSGAPFHYHENAVNILVYGEKLWGLQPPSIAVYSVRHPSSQLLASTASSRGNGAIKCVQRPREALFLPRGWGHSTINLAETTGFAVEY